MNWVMHRVVDRSGCGAPLGEATIIDLNFADDVVILSEVVDGLVCALEVLSEQAVLGTQCLLAEDQASVPQRLHGGSH